MNSETKYYVIPEFSGANIPVNEAAHIMKKDPAIHSSRYDTRNITNRFGL